MDNATLLTHRRPCTRGKVNSVPKLTAYMNGGSNAVQAGIAIGMSKRSARANTRRCVAAILSCLSMQQVLAETGIVPRQIAETLAQLIDCRWSRNGIQPRSIGTFSTIRQHNSRPSSKSRGS
jgi:hypothetical protein